MESPCRRLMFDALAGAHMLVGLHDMRGMVWGLCVFFYVNFIEEVRWCIKSALCLEFSYERGLDTALVKPSHHAI